MGSSKNWLLEYYSDLPEDNIIARYIHDILSDVIKSDMHSRIKLGSVDQPAMEFTTNAISRMTDLTTQYGEIEGDGLPFENPIEYLFDSNNDYRWYIDKITFVNYRQFLGTVEIDLGYSLGKNMNIIKGGNGFGKTTILYALGWVLYDVELKFGDNGSSKNLIHNHVLETSKDDIETTKVIVEIRNSNERIVLTRTKEYFKHQGEWKSRKSNLSILVVPENKSVREIPKSEHSDFIDTILPREIYNYFLFDGENVDEILLNKQNNIETISALIDLNTLKYVKEIMKEAQSKILNEVKDNNKNVSKIAKLESQNRDLTLKIKELERKKSKASKELHKLFIDRDEIEKEIKEYGDINLQKLSQDKLSFEKEIRLLGEKIEDENISYKFKLITLYPKKALIKQVKRIIFEAETFSKPLGFSITEELMDQISQMNTCICGRDITEEKFNELYSLIKGKEEMIFTKSIQKNYLQTIDQEVKEPEILDFAEHERRLKSFMDEIASLKKKISDIDKAISGLDDIKYNQLERSRKEIRTEIRSVENSIDNYKDELERIRKKISNNEATINRIYSITRKDDTAPLAITNFHNTINEFNRFITSIHEGLRGELQTRIYYYCKEIMNRIPFNSLLLTENYLVEVYQNNFNITLDLSEGQKQLLAYSYIMALSSMSGFDAPIIIDYPLGSLDEENRINFCVSLPRILPNTQITFIVLNTEYTEGVQNALEPYTYRRLQIQLNNGEIDPPRRSIIVPYDDQEVYS